MTEDKPKVPFNSEGYAQGFVLPKNISKAKYDKPHFCMIQYCAYEALESRLAEAEILLDDSIFAIEVGLVHGHHADAKVKDVYYKLKTFRKDSK